MWLGKLRLSQGKRNEAIELWLKIQPSSDQFRDATRLVEAATQQELATAKESQTTPQDLENRAAQFLEQAFLTQGALPEHWTDFHRWALIASTRLRLLGQPPDLSRTAKALTAILQSPTESEDDRDTCRALLGICLLRTGEYSEARAQLQQVNWAMVEQPLTMITELRTAGPEPPPAGATQEAQIVVEVTRRMLASDMPWTIEQQQTLALHQAAALTQTGDYDAAVDLYRQLAVGRPKDRTVLKGYATCLQTHDEMAALQQALNLWRRVTRLSPTGSTDWFRAKLAIARLHIRLGDPTRAAEMIRLTQTLHPDLGGIELQQQFLRTLRECESVR